MSCIYRSSKNITGGENLNFAIKFATRFSKSKIVAS
jgi:hypothetical protein